ncbi:MAG: DUF393 domain-containing protein [Gammaproteobacteria bacterium]
MSSKSYPLTLFFDSACPLCAIEMRQLQQLDKDGNLRFEDILAPGFAERFPHIDPVKADRILHAEYADGQLIYGLDVTQQSWAAVNRKRWLAVLRWPVIRWLADIAYGIFARNRYTISYWLTGTRRCEPCASAQKSDSSCAVDR